MPPAINEVNLRSPLNPVSRIPALLRSIVKHRYLYFMFIPVIAYYVVFKYVPIYGVQIAFKDYRFNLGIWGSEWVGLQVFRDLITSPTFGEVFRNTIVISLYKLAVGFPAPIFFALLLNEIVFSPYKKVIQTVSYLPHFVSWVILGGLFLQFLSPSIGPINIFLKSIGIKPIYFLASPRWFQTVLVVTSTWKTTGWGSIVYLASIAGINPELYEAAIVDGAGRLRRMVSITLPCMMPVITIMFIFAVGGIINDDFDQIFNMYNPAVYSVGDVISTYTYRVGLIRLEYSFATAVGLFRNVIALALIATTNTITKRINEYGLW